MYLSSDRVSKVVQSVYSALRAIHTLLEIGMSSALYFMSRPTISFRDFSIASGSPDLTLAKLYIG